MLVHSTLVSFAVNSTGSLKDQVLQNAQDYGLSREDLDFVFSVTHFKSKADWAADPMKVRLGAALGFIPQMRCPWALPANRLLSVATRHLPEILPWPLCGLAGAPKRTS